MPAALAVAMERAPGTISPRYVDYARERLDWHQWHGHQQRQRQRARPDAGYLAKVTALADLWRPMRSPHVLSAPLRSSRWPEDRRSTGSGRRRLVEGQADEIYKLIPDSAGFLVKANSEGQPGPKDYGRNHAGAPTALPMRSPVTAATSSGARSSTTKTWIRIAPSAPTSSSRSSMDSSGKRSHPGQERRDRLHAARTVPPIVWRAEQDADHRRDSGDSSTRAGEEHLVYLGTMWEEFLDADTYAKGRGRPSAR